MLSNTKLFWIFLGGIALVLLGSLLFWQYLWLSPQSQTVDVVIDGVPPVTIYNHTGDNAYIVTDLAAVLVSVLKYYGEDLSVSELDTINHRFFDEEDFYVLHQLEDIKAYAEELGYSATIEVPQSIDNFRKYFTAERPTPVIFSHFMEIGQNPEIRFKPMGLLIGMLDSERAMVVHDYYFGYNKKLSYRDFGKLGAYPAQVLIIKPKIPREVDRSAVPEHVRTADMDKAEQIINKITLAKVAQGKKQYPIAASYYRQALNSPDFESVVPTYYKLAAMNGGINSYIRIEKDYDSASKLAKKAEAMNHDLDEPFGDFWPGFVDETLLINNQYPQIYYWLGRIHEHNKQYNKAISYYGKALTIYPYGPAEDGVRRVHKKMEKSEQ